MPEVKWIKITTDMFDDEKIKLLEAMPDADTLLVIWVKLICQAGKVNSNGYIFLSENLPYTEEQFATIFNQPVNTIRLALQAFRKLEMISIDDDGTILLPNFSKHQNTEGLEKIREQTRLRVAKHRQLKAGNEDVTPSNVTVTQQNKNRIDKNRKEIDKVNTFDIFWNAYPKKKSKGQAETAFKKVNPDDQLLQVILKAIEEAKKSEGWLKDGGQYIPYPATWLNAKGWEDEIQKGGKNGTYREDPFAAAKGLKPYTRPPVFRD